MAVYFIRAGETDWIKIGFAADVEQRRRELQCAHFLPLTVIRTIDGTPPQEGWLHRHYDARRGLGEWFKFCPTMLEIEPPALLARVGSTSRVAEIIDRCGLSRLSRELGHRWPTTVQGWRDRGQVPSTKLPDFVAACRCVGVDTTYEYIFGLPEKSTEAA